MSIAESISMKTTGHSPFSKDQWFSSRPELPSIDGPSYVRSRYGDKSEPNRGRSQILYKHCPLPLLTEEKWEWETALSLRSKNKRIGEPSTAPFEYTLHRLSKGKFGTGTDLKFWFAPRPATEIPSEQDASRLYVSVLMQDEDWEQIPTDLRAALEEWQRVPDEAREEEFPVPTRRALHHSLRLLKTMYKLSPRRFEVYPTPEGEIAIEGTGSQGQWVILYCESGGGALCIFGNGNQDGYKRYKNLKELPDIFLQKVLNSLGNDVSA